MSHRYRSSCCCGEEKASPCFFGWGAPPKTIYDPAIIPGLDSAWDGIPNGYADITGKTLANIHDNWEFCSDSTEDELVFVIERPHSEVTFSCTPEQDADSSGVCPCIDGPLITSNTSVGTFPPGPVIGTEVSEIHAPIIARYRHTWTKDQINELPYGTFKKTGRGLPDRASELYQYSFSSARIGGPGGGFRSCRLYPLEGGFHGETSKHFANGDALGWPSLKYPYDGAMTDGWYGSGNPCYCQKVGQFGCYDNLCGYHNFFTYCQGGSSPSNFTHLSPNYGLPCTRAQANIIGLSGDADMWRTSNFGWVRPFDYYKAIDLEEPDTPTRSSLREYELGGQYFWLQGIAVDTQKTEEQEDCYYDFGVDVNLEITYIPRNGPFNGNARLHQTLLGVIHREKWNQLYYNSLLVEHNKVNDSNAGPACDTYLKGVNSEAYSDLFSPQVDWFGYPPTNDCISEEAEGENGYPLRQDGEDVFNNRVPKYWIQSCAGVPIFSWEIALNDKLKETRLEEVMDADTIGTLAAAFESMTDLYGSIPGGLNDINNLKEISVARYLMLIFSGFPFWYQDPGTTIPTGVITPDIARILVEEGILPGPENGGLENGYKIYNKTMKVASNCGSDEGERKGMCCYTGGAYTANCWGDGWTGPYETDEDSDNPGGCDIPSCNDAVCAVDPFCCEVEWDENCEGYAENFQYEGCQIEFSGCEEDANLDQCRWYGGQWTANPLTDPDQAYDPDPDSSSYNPYISLICADPDDPESGDQYAVCIANGKGVCGRRCQNGCGVVGDDPCGCPTPACGGVLDTQPPGATEISDIDCYNDCQDLEDNSDNGRGRACVCFETYAGKRDDNDIPEGVAGYDDASGEYAECPDGSETGNPCGGDGDPPNYPDYIWRKNTNCININGREAIPPCTQGSPVAGCAARCGPPPPASSDFPTFDKQQWFYGKPGGWFHADWDGAIFTVGNENGVPIVTADNHNNLFPQFLGTRNEAGRDYAAPWPQYGECTDVRDCNEGRCPCTMCDHGSQSPCWEDKGCVAPLCHGCGTVDQDTLSGPCTHESTSDTCNGTWLQWSVSSASPSCDTTQYGGLLQPVGDRPGAFGCSSVNNAWVLKTTPWLVYSGDDTEIFVDNYGPAGLSGWKPSVAFDDPTITPRYDDDGITYDRPKVDWFHPPYKISGTNVSSSSSEPCCWTTATRTETGGVLPNGLPAQGICPTRRSSGRNTTGLIAQNCLDLGDIDIEDGGGTGDYCSEFHCGFFIRDSAGEYDIDPACGKICEPDDNGVLRFCCPYTGQCVPVGTGSTVCTQCAETCDPGTHCCMGDWDGDGEIWSQCVPEGECEDIGTVTP